MKDYRTYRCKRCGKEITTCHIEAYKTGQLKRLLSAESDTIFGRSYMPSLICRYIIPPLPELTDKTLECFERDIVERKRTGFDFGDSCDYETWHTFYKAVCKEIERRGHGSQTD